RVLAKVTNFLDGYLTDPEFIDLLRITQLALIQGKIDPEKIPGFKDRIFGEFPAGDGKANKQLAMIMAYLKNGNANGRIENYFENSENSVEDKLFIAMQFQTMGRHLDDASRFAVIDFLENAMLEQQGTTYRNYVNSAIKQLVKYGSREQQLEVILQNGGQWPHAMLQAFFRIGERLNEKQVQHVIEADREMVGADDTMMRRVRLGIIAVLAESRDEKAHEYLRTIWQSRPDYRNEISIGLAQIPTGRNWSYLVTSLPILDDTIGQEVVRSLLKVNRRPKNPRQYRDLIELGFRLRESGALEVSRLLRHWTGEEVQLVSTTGKRWEQNMNYWAQWYATKWPDETPINSKPMTKVGNHTAGRVLAHLEEFQIQGNHALGKSVFQKANCVVCHRIGNEGATFGPDLSNLASRFSSREILESIIEPSKIVSDQYKSKRVLTVDGEQLFGMLIRDTGGDFLLQDTKGKTVRLAQDDIEDVTDSDLSSMPEGLLDTLSLDEILHLFAYLNKSSNNGRLSQENSSLETTR
ncbi:MAG: c-type cytochrome, partial [Planctomycetota bacterium]